LVSLRVTAAAAGFLGETETEAAKEVRESVGAAEGGAETGAEAGAELGEERRWTSVHGSEIVVETEVSETEAEVGAEAGRDRDTEEEEGVIVLFLSSGEGLRSPERMLFSSVFKGSAVEEEEVAVSWNSSENVSENDWSSSARCKASMLSAVKIAGVVAPNPICDLMDKDDDEDEVLKFINGLVSVGNKLVRIFPGSVNLESKLSAVSDSSLLLSQSTGTLVGIRAVEQI
jgi:hypothetical protein